MTTTTTTRGWIGDAAPHDAELFRLRALEGTLDPQTTRLLRDEVGVRAGWRCLEVGAGAGSITRWLSERVGPSGHVVALDMNCRFLTDLPANVSVVEHRLGGEFPDIATFDLIHHRALLNYVPEPAKELATLTKLLRPGGWILSEEMVFPHSGLDLVFGGDQRAREAGGRLCDTALELLRQSGTDMRFGREVPGLLRDAGLIDVSHIGSSYVTPGSDGCRSDVWWPLCRALSTQFEALGLPAQEVEAGVAALRDPSVWHTIPNFISAWGRRAG
jgi:SAM-dependent methyltransferase